MKTKHITCPVKPDIMCVTFYSTGSLVDSKGVSHGKFSILHGIEVRSTCMPHSLVTVFTVMCPKKKKTR